MCIVYALSRRVHQLLLLFAPQRRRRKSGNHPFVMSQRGVMTLPCECQQEHPVVGLAFGGLLVSVPFQTYGRLNKEQTVLCWRL